MPQTNPALIRNYVKVTSVSCVFLCLYVLEILKFIYYSFSSEIICYTCILKIYFNTQWNITCKKTNGIHVSWETLWPLFSGLIMRNYIKDYAGSAGNVKSCLFTFSSFVFRVVLQVQCCSPCIKHSLFFINLYSPEVCFKCTNLRSVSQTLYSTGVQNLMNIQKVAK